MGLSSVQLLVINQLIRSSENSQAMLKGFIYLGLSLFCLSAGIAYLLWAKTGSYRMAIFGGCFGIFAFIVLCIAIVMMKFINK